MKLRPGLQLLRETLCLVAAAVNVCRSRAAAAVPQPSVAEIRRRLAAVFARPEFSGTKTLAEWLQEQIQRLFAWLGGLQSTSPFLFWLLLAGCLTLLVLLGAHLAWTVRRVLFVGSEPHEKEQAAEKRKRLSLAYWQEAQHRAARREFTEAIRFLFLSLVYRFDESGRASFQRASTNREYLSLFADRPEVRAELAVFVDTLDDHWYGQRPTDRRQYENCLALYESLK